MLSLGRIFVENKAKVARFQACGCGGNSGRMRSTLFAQTIEWMLFITIYACPHTET